MKKIFLYLILPGLLGANESLLAVDNPNRSSFIDVHMHLDSTSGGSASTGTADSPDRPEIKRDRNRATGNAMTPRERQQMRQKNRQRMQNSDSSNGRARNFTPSSDVLVEIMDRYGVAKSIVMPPPQNAGQKGSYDYKSLLPVISAHPGRLMLGAGGGTLSPMILGTPSSEVTETLKAEFRNIAENLVNAGTTVFGEMSAMHLCMNPKHHFSSAPPDHPLFLLLADIAAEKGIPIDLHMEAIEKAMPVSNRLAEACDQNPVSIPATIDRLERLLAHNRDAHIVWQHIGWDNTGGMTPALMNRLLGNNPNLYLAIKSTGKTEGKRPNTISGADGAIKTDWLELFFAFPDRIMVGADEFSRAEGSGGYKKPPFFQDTWTMIKLLPDSLIQKIGHDNAARVYGI